MKKKLDIENSFGNLIFPWFIPVCCVLAAGMLSPWECQLPALPTLIRERGHTPLLHHNGIAMQSLHNNEPIALEDTLHIQG